MPDTRLNADGLSVNHRLQEEWELTARAAREKLENGTLLLVDVRLEPEWNIARIAQAPQAVLHIPLHELENRWEEIEEHPLVANGAAVAALCHHGVRSLKAAVILREKGISNVKSVAGGIEAWSIAVDTSVPRYERDGVQVRKV